MRHRNNFTFPDQSQIKSYLEQINEKKLLFTQMDPLTSLKVKCILGHFKSLCAKENIVLVIRVFTDSKPLEMKQNYKFRDKLF